MNRRACDGPASAPWDPIAINLQQEVAMYATIRRYSSTSAMTEQTIEEFKQRLENKFVPMVSDIRGFHSYGILTTGEKEMVTITFCEDRQGTAESTRRAAEFVQKDPLKDQLGKPEVIEGELLVLKEAGVGA